MRSFCAAVFILAICLSGSLGARAQEGDSSLVSGNILDGKLITLLDTIEKQTGYFFYYDTATIDTVRVSVSFDKVPLSRALNQALANTRLFYSIDSRKHIFITSGQVVKTELPEAFYSKTRKPVSDENIGIAMESENDPSDVQVQKAVLENKLYYVGEKWKKSTADKVTVAGYVREAKTGEPVTGASIQIEKLNIGITTDAYGFYSIDLPPGKHIFNIQSIGMADTRRQVMVYNGGRMDIDLAGHIIALKKVIVSAQKVSNIKGTQMGVQKIDIATIKQVPVVFGEADILKVVLSLPGVKSVGEASTGLNVRGGSADQNLILFNDATIFNPSHFFGMFSAFNPEIVKDVTLYKSSIPARYGGRLSSVLDITSREGNKKKIAGSAGIGVLTSRINIEGPLIKDKSSFIIGARTTYAKWLLNLLPDQYKNSVAGFSDFNLNVTHEINKNNFIYLTGYLSNDRFNLNSDTTYQYGNQNISLKWKHNFSNKINGLFTTGLDRYKYSISSDKNPVNAYKLGFDINQLYLKAHFNYYLSASHTVDFGISSIRYQLDPGSYTPLGGASLVQPDVLEKDQALESAIYLNDKYTVSSGLSVEGGIRFSVFDYLGPKSVNEYAPGKPITEENKTGTLTYQKGKFINQYTGPEFRFGARYALSENLSVKAGYNSQRQYIHVLSNTTAIAPTDIWKLSDPNIRPQKGDQVSLGLYKNFKSNTIETSLEGYYKKIADYLDYKSGASLIMNHHIETEVLETKGKAYGVELLVKKLTGKVNGWVSYTWSRILLRQNDPNQGEIINKGSYYPANYDRPHDFTFIGNYRVNHRFSISLNATYSTGRPITLPIGGYYYEGAYRTLYADRNSYRIPDYFRTDFSMNLDGNYKVNQKTHNSWTLGVYNLTARKNPYSIYFVSENGIINGYKLSIFGSAIPYINFNITF